MTTSTAAAQPRPRPHRIALGPLDPWLAARTGEAAARELGAVALSRAGDVARFAAPPGDGAALTRRLQQLTGFRIELVHTHSIDIDLALERLYGGDRAEGAMWAHVLALLASLGYLHSEQTTGDAAARVETLLRTTTLRENVLAEAVGLAFGVPRVRLDAWPAQTALTLLVPHDRAKAHLAAPLYLKGHTLLLTFGGLPSVELIDDVARSTGLDVRPVVAERSAVGERIAALYANGRQIEDNGAPIAETLLRLNAIDRAALAQARAVAANTGEPVERALLRLGRIDADDLRRAEAERLHVRPFQPDGVDRDIAALLPRATGELLGAMPYARSGDTVRVAMLRPDDGGARFVLERILAHNVDAKLCSPEQLRTLLEGAAAGPRPMDATEMEAALLHDGPYCQPPHLRAAKRKAREDRIDLYDALLGAGALSPVGFAELQAIARDVAWVDSLCFSAGRPAAAIVGEETAIAREMLPLWFDGPMLLAAFRAPPAESPEALANAIGAPVRAVLAPATTLDAARSQVYRLDTSMLSRELRDLAVAVEQEGIAGREDILRALTLGASEGEPTDVALARIHGVSAAAVARVLARYVGWEMRDIGLRDLAETVIDAVGQTRLRRTVVDPVDHRAAERFDVATAGRLGALPIEETAEGYVVAFADPFDNAALNEAATALARPLTPVVATRMSLLQAAGRARGQSALGDYLLVAGLITREQLEAAAELHQRSGVRLGKALLSLGFISEAQLAAKVAEQCDLPSFSLEGMDIDERYVRLLPERFARERGIVVLAEDDGRYVAGTSDPLDAESLRQAEEHLGRPLDLVVIAEGELEETLERVYRIEYLERSATELMARAPEDSAFQVLSRGQKIGMVTLAALSVAALIVQPILFLTFVFSGVTIFYATFSLYKFFVIYRALSHELEIPTTPEELAALNEADLPVYTIFVPLYREAEVLPILVRAIDRLDYPKTKLDVKLLLEEDDVETVEVARAMNLPDHFDLLVVPDGHPKGKPKACNYGLLHAKGEYCVIYDAEDIPERDQLKKAVVAFRKAAPEVFCIQAKLNYFNRDQNVLTRWFTIEYSMWFDLMLPGLDSIHAPIPLGGTSNHFRTEELRAAGAWDPFNVTEDADLGLRIFKRGGRTAVIESTTFEEANSVLDNWIRQRSRWVKGYIQTYLVHMRNPYTLWRSLGTGAFLSFQMVIGGTFMSFLVNPLLWGLTALWYATKWGVIEQIFPGPMFYFGAVSLYFGNFAFAYTNVAGCLRREYYGLVPYALISPLYWVLMSLGAWKGFLQLFYRPFYWEKTVHGLHHLEQADSDRLVEAH